MKGIINDNTRMKAALIVAIVTLFALGNDSNPLMKIIDGMEDSILKEKLIHFEKQGVERTIPQSKLAYDREAVIQYAVSLLGTPHKMGGCSSQGVDCSGLVMLSHSVSNVRLPHSSEEQARYGKIITSPEELKRGDLIFFHSTYSTARLITHAGIYLGDGEFIHTSTRRGVVISVLEAERYWSERFLFATRLSE